MMRRKEGATGEKNVFRFHCLQKGVSFKERTGEGRRNKKVKKMQKSDKFSSRDSGVQNISWRRLQVCDNANAKIRSITNLDGW
ncbi:unnamed protein product [Dovyalis caffra]|uniref:Uncharacterized protein n=1 Tax=Dovyalis caffra TaxID=77055 RepID=A0AAV1RMT2_9ROSI|nr:unnamed protein product [Dovyalis caffra]